MSRLSTLFLLLSAILGYTTAFLSEKRQFFYVHKIIGHCFPQFFCCFGYECHTSRGVKRNTSTATSVQYKSILLLRCFRDVSVSKLLLLTYHSNLQIVYQLVIGLEPVSCIVGIKLSVEQFRDGIEEAARLWYLCFNIRVPPPFSERSGCLGRKGGNRECFTQGMCPRGWGYGLFAVVLSQTSQSACMKTPGLGGLADSCPQFPSNRHSGKRTTFFKGYLVSVV